MPGPGAILLPRVKRVGRVNKGDKIKFGVLVPQRDVKPKKNVEDKETFESPFLMRQKARAEIGVHSDHVYKIVNNHTPYTTVKTLPTALISAHKNIIN